ncbi:MAG: calcium-binding protein, partial [Pirellulaceae bacterium]
MSDRRYSKQRRRSFLQILRDQDTGQNSAVQRAFETLEDRRMLATVPITGPDQSHPLEGVDATGNDTYEFSQNNSWQGTKITEHAASTDTLDFSQVTEDLTFRIKAKHTVEVTDGTNTAIATHVERFIPGRGENIFIVEKGAALDDGGILNNPDVTTESVVLAYTSDYANPNKLFASGVSKPVQLDLEAKTSSTNGVSFTVVDGVLKFIGGKGNDTLAGKATTANDIRGGKGNDTIEGGSAADLLIGDDGDDTLRGLDGDDRKSGAGTGADLAGLVGGDGSDTIYAGLGDDIVDGGDGRDTLIGDEGDDFLYGGDGADKLTGDHDLFTQEAVTPTTGNDYLAGGSGNDTYAFAAAWGQDTLVEQDGNGTDTLDFSRVDADLTTTLGGSSSAQFIAVNHTNTAGGNDHHVHATNNIENLLGGSGVNTYKVLDAFGGTLEVDGFNTRTFKVANEVAPNDLPTAVLDLSSVTQPVTITVAKGKTGAKHNVVTVTFASGLLEFSNSLELNNVATIVGTQELDTITFADGASLVGDLDGGTGEIEVVYSKSVPTDQQGSLP